MENIKINSNKTSLIVYLIWSFFTFFFKTRLIYYLKNLRLAYNRHFYQNCFLWVYSYLHRLQNGLSTLYKSYEKSTLLLHQIFDCQV